MRFTLFSLAVLPALSPITSAFSFTAGDPTQCDDLDISWTGGSPPFQLLLVPVFGTPRNFSIPNSSFSDGKGTFSVQLPYASGKPFLITMSDSKGFGTGGSTPILKTGSSRGGSCDVKEPNVAFDFQLNSALQQCRPYVFSEYVGAVQPVNIMAIIPGGESFVLSPPKGPTSFEWIANVRSGNSLIFVMTDSAGRQGGSSAELPVGPSDNSGCLQANSPSSTWSSSTPSETKSPTTSSPPASSSSSPKSSTPIGMVLATVLGSLIFLAVSITLGLFFLRRRRERNVPWNESRLRRSSQRIPPQTNFGEGSGGPPSPYHYPHPTTHSPSLSGNHPYLSPSENPFTSPYSPTASSVLLGQDPFNPPSSAPPSTRGQEGDPFNPPGAHSPASMSTAQRKAAMAGSSAYKPSRFILHTDIEDTPNDEEEVVELPPQYSARHAASAHSTVSPGARPPPQGPPP